MLKLVIEKNGLSKLLKVVRLILEEMKLTVNLPNYQKENSDILKTRSQIAVDKESKRSMEDMKNNEVKS